jgi:hypothetical protein
MNDSVQDHNDSNNPEQSAVVHPNPIWWLAQILLTAAACFFVFFGISLLIAAYQLKDPFSFIMTFFAANLIILISAVMVVGFVMRALRRLHVYRNRIVQDANKKNNIAN